MNKIPFSFKVNCHSAKVFQLAKPAAYELATGDAIDDIVDYRNILSGTVVSTDTVIKLNKAKDYIGSNWKVYVKNRDKVVPKTKTYCGYRSRYHTFVKLKQALELAAVDEKFHSFYDLAFAPGAFTEGLLRTHDIKRCYGITLKEDGLRVDRAITSDKRFTMVSPDDGDMYKKANLDASSVVGKVDLVCGDGGFDVSGKDENLQSLMHYHLIFCEFVYAANFCREGGTFVCKLFDTFDEYTANVIMAATVLFDTVKITKPDESRLVNSERYIVCTGFHQNAELTAHLNKMLEASETATPGLVFKSLDFEFLQSLKLATESIATLQTKEIYRVVDACKRF